MLNTHGKSPLKAHKRIWMVFFVMLTVFLLLTITNEILDLPHYLFDDSPTTFPQRKGEVMSELLTYCLVIFLASYYFKKKIAKEIRILEGFIPICANCKKIRQDIDWKTLEDYISANSLAKFNHSLCPDCIRTLYPVFANKLLNKKDDTV